MPALLFYFMTLLTAYFLTEIARDFLFLQSNRDFWWSRLLILVLNGVLAYGLSLQWQAWLIIPLVLVLHAMVEWIPTPFWRSFLVKQGLRSVLMAAAALWLASSMPIRLSLFPTVYLQGLILFCGFYLTIFAVGAFIAKVTEQMALENQLEWRGLDNGGLWIGRLERLLIFIFVGIGLPAGIGFLVAAKSILRFSDTRDDQKMAEYVLIGTLLSFSAAIVFAYLTWSGLHYLSKQSF